MRNDTRLKYTALAARIAQLNNVDSINHSIEVAPNVQQKLETRIQESSDFLGRINVIGVREQEGETLGLGVSGPIASRTDTSGDGERKTRDVSKMDRRGYRCEKTNYDTHLRYAVLDAWAAFPDFETRVRDTIIRRQALDRIMIGFNGTHVAADSDLAANPMLQDVNVGWLQKIRLHAPARHMSNVQVGPNVGADGYKNVDAAVFDAIQLLDPWHRNGAGLVAILGRELLHDKYFPLVNTDQAPTEKLASDIIISQKRVGGLQAVTVPFVPDNAILITSLDNLSIYWQTGARRRRMIDNPAKDRIENFESSNDAYVVEDYGRAALLELAPAPEPEGP